MKLRPGQRPEADFLGSMAEAIGKVFEHEWHRRYGYHLPVRGREDRKLLYVAIAQGVVKHLVDRSDQPSEVNSDPAFRVHTVETTQEDSLITSSGKIDFGYGWEYTVDVTQDSDPSNPNFNKVRREGEGKLEILAEGILNP